MSRPPTDTSIHIHIFLFTLVICLKKICTSVALGLLLKTTAETLSSFPTERLRHLGMAWVLWFYVLWWHCWSWEEHSWEWSWYHTAFHSLGECRKLEVQHRGQEKQGIEWLPPNHKGDEHGLDHLDWVCTVVLVNFSCSNKCRKTEHLQIQHRSHCGF